MWLVDFFAAYWLVLKYMLYFAAVVILLSSIDDFFIDCYYWVRRLWRRLTVYRVHKPFDINELYKNPEKPIAILVPAWQESGVIGDMAALMASNFEYFNYHIFIGTYPNDPATQQDVDIVAQHYRNVYKVVNPLPGPTSKSDCLNRIIEYIFEFEKNFEMEFEVFVLHDAEDLIHPLELKLFNHLIRKNDLIQIPVFPFEREWYDLTNGHYEDEFAENHGKDLIVRESILGFVPSAGVGTGLSRNAIMKLKELHKGDVFLIGTLTEDYNLGYELFQEKMKLIFVRMPAEMEYVKTSGGEQRKSVKQQELITVREFFPSSFWKAVNQKSRWLIGIALQGWEKIGWSNSFITNYILYRDRKGIFTNLANVMAYILVISILLMNLYSKLTTDAWWFPPFIEEGTVIWYILIINFFFFLNRIFQRMYFTYIVYGARGSLMSFPRIVWGNFINFFAMWRAIKQFFGSKKTNTIPWDKTKHDFPVTVKFNKKLGDILSETGLIDQDTLRDALQEQKARHKPLGKLLVSKGVISDRQLAQAMALQNDLTYIDIDSDRVDTEAMAQFDRFDMLRYDLLLLKKEGALRPVISSGQVIDVKLEDIKERLAEAVELFISDERSIQALQKELLFPELTPVEFVQLHTILKQKMIPANMIDRILERRAEEGLDLIAACQAFGFLPEDQLKRIQA